MHKKFRLNIYLFILILSFNAYADKVAISVDIDINISNCSEVNDTSIVQIQNASCLSSTNLPNLPVQADIDALHVLPNDSVIFSIKAMASIDGQNFNSNDLIIYDGSSFLIWLSGETMGIPKNVNIDAVSVIGDDVYLSVDSRFDLDNNEYHPSTVIKYNQGLSVFKEYSDLNISVNQNIDALQVVSPDTIYYSLNTAKSLTVGYLARAEIAMYDNSTTSKYFSMLSQNNSWYQTDVDALYIEFDLIYKNGFE